MPHEDQSSSLPSRQSLLDLFHILAQAPGDCILYDNGYRSWKYTYVQVAHAARRFAARLRERKIGEGDKVIFWSENRPEWIAAFWGCILAGAIVVPIDYRASSRFLQRVREIVDARLILVGEEVESLPCEGRPPVWPLCDLEWPSHYPDDTQVTASADDVAEIVFTSGATGEPKGVLITHRNILANLATPEQIISTYAKWFRPLFPLRFLSLIPLSHMFGQVLTIFILPLVPAVAVFMHGYGAGEIARQIRKRRISVLVAVPRILEVLRQYIAREFPRAANPRPETSHWILSWWRYRRVHTRFGWKFWAVVVGAAPLPRELEDFWSRLGFAVIQGYGLTETAPVVTFNNPFAIKEGTVGRPVAGIEVKVAPDGEILVRGESVTSGYYKAPEETAKAFEHGWFHTGDVGKLDEEGHLIILGRKKEMIVTPEGLNVFPQDVEAVLDEIPGVRESAVVGRDRVHAVLALEAGSDPDEIVRRANLELEDHQKIRSFSVWPGDRLPRTESTQKLKHAEIQSWAEGRAKLTEPPSGNGVVGLLRKYAPDRTITPRTTLAELGLSSLDRVELMIDLESHFDTNIDESLLTAARTVSELSEFSTPARGVRLPAWNRSWWARAIRNVLLSVVWFPLTRLFAHAHISGREHLRELRGPVVFAPNHQSHVDTPLIVSALPSRYRFRVAVVIWQEYFDAFFFPARHKWHEWLVQAIVYHLIALFFNAFPLPQTEAGARQSLRHIGDLVSEGWSVLFFPEGERTEAGEIHPFQPGIGLIAGRLGVPIVPIRIHGAEKVLHRTDWLPRPGRVDLFFGPPLRLKGTDYAALAKQVEQAVRVL